MANFERHWMESPYHYCSRCKRRKQLDQLTWQEGQLLCEWDLDTMLIGERETVIMRVLDANSTAQELAPDRKLTEPNAGGIIDEVMLG